ncbi:hypothetical protein [Hyalangium versicolor]|uniref:hypothetical protein n=1 Tax=Hyalangium versicolor TaxID=2861190 RepID=UPI001CCEA297|nr:hypothetical protein [Hyalangium versicolor]
MNDKLHARLREIRRQSVASLHAAALHQGMSADALERRILGKIKEDRRRELSEHPLLADREFIERILACQNLEEALAFTETDLQRFFAHDIIDAVQNFGIAVDSDYLRSIAQRLELGYPPDYPIPKLILALIEHVPVMWLFNSGFSAFFTPRFEFDEIPVVQYHHEADSVLSVCVHAVLGRALTQTEHGIDMLSGEALAALAGGENIDEDVSELIRVLNGGFIEARTLQSAISRSPEGRHMLQVILSLMNIFILSHEYAHMLLGHVRIGLCHRAEYEADLFASAVLSTARFRNLYQETWFAIAIIFLVLDIDIRGKESPTHPKPLDRFNALANRTGHGDAFRQVLRMLASLLNPSLKRQLGYEVRV